jgi:hypothetical protein
MRLGVMVLALCVSVSARAAPRRRLATTVHKPPPAAIVRPAPLAKPAPSPYRRVSPLPLRVVN